LEVANTIIKEIILFNKLMVPICFFVAGLFFFTQYTIAAEPGAGYGRACDAQKASGQQQPLDPEAEKKYEKFMLETVDLRKELGEKQAAFQSLMASENPDPSKIAMLTQEYYQLRDFITEKAMLAGLMEKSQGCNGCGGKSGVACGRPASGKNVEKTN
jgi:hypothetical protein